MRILFLSHNFYPDIGGIEVNSEVLAEAFVKAGHIVRLLTWSADTTRKVFPFAIIRNPNKRTLLKEHFWADLIFENNPCLRLSWPRLFITRPSVIALNTWISRANGTLGFQDKLKFRWLKRASKVIAVSDAVRQRCYTNSIVIGNPYKAKDFKILGDADRNKDFVFLGRLVSDKGADQIVYALHKLTKWIVEGKGFDITPTLTIVGDGPERKKLEGLVEDFKLEDKVKFTGSLVGEELTACLNQHQFILIPSVWEEPFGNVALEGMACGCLPIVSDGGGLPTAVGSAGLTFKRGNVDSLVDCIKKVISDPQLEKRLRAAAPHHLNNHHPDKVAGEYLKVINDALNNNF